MILLPDKNHKGTKESVSFLQPELTPIDTEKRRATESTELSIGIKQQKSSVDREFLYNSIKSSASIWNLAKML